MPSRLRSATRVMFAARALLSIPAILTALLFALALPAAAAKDWPERPIKIVVPTGAGSLADNAARAIAREMQKSLGQPVTVENRVGGDGMAAATAVKKAPPDGYTLLLATSAHLAAPIGQKDAVDAVADFAPISTVGAVPYALLVNAKVPVRSVQELIAYGKASKLAYATTSAGDHLAASQFAKSAGIEMTRVPYNASPIADLAAGKVQVYVAPLGQALAEAKNTRVRVLATLTAERTALSPAVPSLGEETLPVPAGNVSHVMVFAPATTPSEIVAKLAREIQVAVAKREVKADLQKSSLIARASSPGELARQLAEDMRLWQQFLTAAVDSGPARSTRK